VAVRKKSKVLVMAESVPVENGTTDKCGKPRKVGYLKMLVIDDLKSETVDEKVINNIDKQSIIDTDNSTSYANFKTLAEGIVRKSSLKMKSGRYCPGYISLSVMPSAFYRIYSTI
jgi:hypothetical protein